MQARRLIIFVASAALFTLGMVVPGASSAEEPDAAPTGRTALDVNEELPAPLGARPSTDGAIDAPRPATAAGDAAERLAAALENRFAGAWDVPVGGGRSQPTVAVVDPTDTDRDTVTSAVPGAQVVAAKYSLDELTRTEAALAEKLAATGLDEYAVGVNVPTNRVVVYLDTDSRVNDDVAEDLRATAERDDVVVQTVKIAATNYPNGTWAGERIWTTGTGCTTGFAMSNAGGRFMTSAAHCFTGNGQTVLGSHSDSGPAAGAIGTVVGFQGTGSVPGDFAAWYNGGADAVINGANRIVKGAENPVWFEQGVCFRGASSGTERCAGVSDVNLLISSAGRTFRAFCIDHGGPPAIAGDSGSAVYRASAANEARARGIVSGTTGTKTCSTPIGTVTSTYAASVLVK